LAFAFVFYGFFAVLYFWAFPEEESIGGFCL